MVIQQGLTANLTFVCAPHKKLRSLSNRRPRSGICHLQSRSQHTATVSYQLYMRSAGSSPSIDERVLDALSGRSVVVTGGSGLIGRALVEQLQECNSEVVLLSRQPNRARDMFSPRTGAMPRALVYDAEPDEPVSDSVFEAIGQADAIINLAGEPVEDGRWTASRKQILYNSRVNGTRKLVDAVRKHRSNAVLINASAVGYYGPSASKVFTEKCKAGSDYLATIAMNWEQAALANTNQSRTTVFRFGVVLGNGGGALPKMSTAFRAFLGGPPGGGEQWFSWVHIEDVVRLLLHATVDTKWNGVYNATAPQPVRLAEFCQELGKALGRPSWLPVPKQAIQALLGNEAAQLILAGQQVLPKRTRENGFVFKYKDVATALQQLTGSRSGELLEMRRDCR
ncbi:hypothetical protein BWQ96_03752 [Gracilariopsis chorda]|uniref:Ketoreductase domain-containing protein n=1 Tax=Gracilariopsis chorda TaxID=448386 RepID=A0A2V3IXV5_9FLOR|nr:hypothetical protein BWQ96_03752 [Gracilariopsis chorda]|eukprot:PXF46517.1 hypothetical protein BWQ96_03752 [Gracilariopsis chorda]